jgi:ribose 5-phosphate isomerase A
VELGTTVTTGTDTDELKRAAARRALEDVRDGMVLGLGSGTTAEIFLAELADRVRRGLRVTCVPTSTRVRTLADQLGVRVASLNEHAHLDLTVDGADEIDLRTFNLIKGRGGALLREKLVATASDREIIVADESKLVTTLGERQPVPVEVVRFGWRRTADALERLGCTAALRDVEGGPFTTDENHYILDCRFPPIGDPARLAREIKAIVGVVEHGLFIGLAHAVVIAGWRGVQVHKLPKGN